MTPREPMGLQHRRTDQPWELLRIGALMLSAIVLADCAPMLAQWLDGVFLIYV